MTLQSDLWHKACQRAIKFHVDYLIFSFSRTSPLSHFVIIHFFNIFMGLLGNLDINDGQSSGPSPASANVALTSQGQSRQGTFDEINDAQSGDPKYKRAHTRPPKLITQSISILDKIGGNIDLNASAAPTPPPTAAPNQDRFSGKIGNDPQGLFDKMWGALLEGNKPAKEDEGSLGKKGGDIIMGKNDGPPGKYRGLDSVLGDGAAGDQKHGP